MKVYTKLVFDNQGLLIEQESYDYEGPVALANSSAQAAKTKDNPSGEIVKNLYASGQGPLATSLQNTLATPGDDPYTQQQAGLLTDKIRGGYGARGLANSGIAVQGEQDALGQFLATRGEQKQNQAIQILGAGNNMSVVPGKPPTGFMGLKGVLLLVGLLGALGANG